MPANPLTPKPKKRRRSPTFAQMDARKAAVANAPKGSGQVPPPPPPSNPGGGPPPPPTPDAATVDKARQALETLPDAELIAKAEVLLPGYEEGWDRTKLINELIAAGVAG